MSKKQGNKEEIWVKQGNKEEIWVKIRECLKNMIKRPRYEESKYDKNRGTVYGKSKWNFIIKTNEMRSVIW